MSLKCYFVFFLASISNIGFSQSPHYYKNLVMEGGGINGISYGGAMAELEQRNILQKIIRVAGTSAGAIQACLLAVGYNADEITEIIANTPIESFNDDGFINKGTKRLFKEYGWFQGNEFLNTIENLIFNRTGNANLTFIQLHDLAKSYPYRDLYVVGADLSDQKSVIFSYENFPNMRIADAVRVSMSIPLYYKALWLDPAGKIVDGPSKDNSHHLFVDGGILMNYPIGIFDHAKYVDVNESDSSYFNKETLGFRLDKCEQISHEVFNGDGIAPVEINDFNSYLSALTGVLMRNVNPPHPKDIDRTVFINDMGKSSRVRKVNYSEKFEMMICGKMGVIDFFNRINLADK